eukprot:GHUV01046400.1.p1 GENE.GHUV01046400.1~~GHUV01046400.1.p1  ORF type:complete len:130 (-),score=32.66 GHUV01046400.1:219-608(-)
MLDSSSLGSSCTRQVSYCWYHTLLLSTLQDSDVAPMEDDSAPADAAAAAPPPVSSQLPEVELYIHLLVLMYLLDRKQYKQVLFACSALLAAYQQHARPLVILAKHISHSEHLLSVRIQPTRIAGSPPAE